MSQIDLITLENDHFLNGGSFWMMLNPDLKKWWFVQRPIRIGGWTSRDNVHVNIHHDIYQNLLPKGGNRYATVLPDPVSATPITSRPLSPAGHA